jgi:hypothetical protein
MNIPGNSLVSGGSGSRIGRRTGSRLQPNDASSDIPPVLVARLPSVDCTVPPTELHHYISDHELMTLGEANRGWLMALFWAAFGSLLSAVPAAVDGVTKLGASPPSVGWAGIAAAVIAVASLAVIIVAGCAGKSHRHTRSAILADIRARPKVRIRNHSPPGSAVE